VAEHLIRLRGGWEWLGPGSDAAPDAAGTSRRVALPIVWPAPPAVGAVVRLSRAFATPPHDRCLETVVLRLAEVPGLISARLNDGAPARPGPDACDLEMPLDPERTGRNLLVLELDPRAARGQTGAAPRAWGVVALVIRGLGPGDRTIAKS
jgi:hypothetical protein